MSKTNGPQTVQKALLTGASAPRAGQWQPSTEDAAHPASPKKTALIANVAISLVARAMELSRAREYSPAIYSNIHNLQVKYGKELKALEITVDGKNANAYSALMLAKATYTATLEPPGGCGSSRSRMNSIPPMAAPDLSSAGEGPGKAENERKLIPIRELETEIKSLITKACEAQAYDLDIAAHVHSILLSEKERLPSISVQMDGQTMSAERALILCDRKMASLPASQGPW